MTSKLRIKEISDCGNSPRRRMLRDFIVALASRDADTMQQFITDDTSWQIIGDAELSGTQEILAWLQGLDEAVALEIKTLPFHGKEGGVEAQVTYASGQVTEYFHVVIFKSHGKTSPIATVRTFAVRL